MSGEWNILFILPQLRDAVETAALGINECVACTCSFDTTMAFIFHSLQPKFNCATKMKQTAYMPLFGDLLW